MIHKDIKDKLVTILTTLTGNNKPLQAVFGYGEPSPQQYPCVKVQWVGGSETRMDNASNELIMDFHIRVYLREKNTQGAEDQRLDLVTSIHDALRTSANVDTLGGLVHKVEITSESALNVNEEQPVFGFDMNLQVKKLQLIS